MAQAYKAVQYCAGRRKSRNNSWQPAIAAFPFLWLLSFAYRAIRASALPLSPPPPSSQLPPISPQRGFFSEPASSFVAPFEARPGRLGCKERRRRQWRWWTREATPPSWPRTSMDSGRSPGWAAGQLLARPASVMLLQIFVCFSSWREGRKRAVGKDMYGAMICLWVL